MKNTISIIGSGYVGLTTGAILANCGYTVFAVDIDEAKVDSIRSGKSHFYEPGLDNLIQSALEKKTLIPTTSFEEAVPKSSIVISCVGTPDNPDGSPNLTYIYSAAKSIAQNAQKGVIIVQKSTVPVGTGRALISYIQEETPDLNFSYVSNPEFLREGTAIIDTLLTDRVVVGSDEPKARDKAVDLYRTLDSNRKDLAKIARVDIFNLADFESRVITTSLESTELIKVTANAFLALKISFANSIAKLADESEADVMEVMDAVGRDKRIGRAFLNAGRGYGGGCFPKDISGLISSAQSHGVDLHIMSAAEEVNASMPGYIVNKAKQALGTLEGKKVAVLGLAFKPNTSDARKSPGVAIANILDHDGATVLAYDPKANGEAREDLRTSVTVQHSAKDATEGTDAVFIATDWAEFMASGFIKGLELSKGTLLVDCMNAYQPADIEALGLDYVGVGRGKVKIT